MMELEKRVAIALIASDTAGVLTRKPSEVLADRSIQAAEQIIDQCEEEGFSPEVAIDVARMMGAHVPRILGMGFEVEMERFVTPALRLMREIDAVLVDDDDAAGGEEGLEEQSTSEPLMDSGATDGAEADADAVDVDEAIATSDAVLEEGDAESAEGRDDKAAESVTQAETPSAEPASQRECSSPPKSRRRKSGAQRRKERRERRSKETEQQASSAPAANVPEPERQVVEVSVSQLGLDPSLVKKLYDLEIGSSVQLLDFHRKSGLVPHFSQGEAELILASVAEQTGASVEL